MSEFRKTLEELAAATKDDPLAAITRTRKDDCRVAPGMYESTRRLDRGASSRQPEKTTNPAGWERDPALRHYLAMNRSAAVEFLFANRTPKIT